MAYKKWSILALRLALGWLLLYAAYEKFTTPGGFSAREYLIHASTFSGFYTWLSSPGILPIVNLLNMWGQAALGVALILGFKVKYAARLAALMMILYYFPVLKFPYPGTHALIVDDHIIYAAGYLVLDAFSAGKAFGMDSVVRSYS